MGGGQTPISYLAYRAYALDHGIPIEDFAMFRETMYQLDGVYLQMEGEKARLRRAAQPETGGQ